MTRLVWPAGCGEGDIDRRTALKVAAVVPVGILAALFILQLTLDAQVSYAPNWRTAVNTLFLPVGAIPLATLAAIAVMRTGRLQLAWLGAGAIALGSAIVMANWLGSPVGVDAAVKIQNIGALVAGAAHFAGALGAFSPSNAVEVANRRRVITLLATYGGAVAIIVVATALSTAQLLPVFFVQGQGGTNLRQVVMTLATMLFAGSALLSLVAYYYYSSRLSFLYAYGWGLALIGLGQLAYIYSASSGDEMAWLGRFGQWLGAIYLLAACVVLLKGSRKGIAGFHELLESLFPSSAEGYRLLIQSSADAIVSVDAGGRVLVWNRAAENMFGYQSAEAVGKQIVELTGIKILDRSGGRFWEGERELPLNHRDGQEFWARITVAASADSAVPMAAVVIGDISDRKRAEADRERLLEATQAQNEELQAQSREIQSQTEEIQTQNEELQASNRESARATRLAEEATRARDEFLSVAAHELKTPVTSLRGFAQMLLRQHEKRGEIEPQRLSRSLQIMDRQTEKLAKLIWQLLDVSRLDGGRLVLERQPVDLAVLVAQTAETARLSITSHELVVKTCPSANAFVDALRVEQVVTNLIDNAIRYSPGGGPVETSVDVRNGAVEIAVRDHGIGMPPGACERVFDRFYRAHADGSIAGLGLGLYISKEIVTLHGGTIRAECPPDGGARFVVSLPVGGGQPDGHGRADED